MGQALMSGKQTVQMDQRGRISFPAAYRAALGNTLYITPDQGERGYLIVRSQDGYEAEIARITADCNAKGYDFEDTLGEVTDFTSRTASASADKNGRVTLERPLVEYAELTGKVTVVGAGEFALIWDEERYAKHEQERAELRARRRAKKDRDKAAQLAALSAEEA